VTGIKTAAGSVHLQEIGQGLWGQNPLLRLGLGICTALAVSGSFRDSCYVGLVVTLLLMASNTVFAIFGGKVPQKLGLVFKITIIASFITAADGIMKIYYADIHQNLGIYLPLVAVNGLAIASSDAMSQHGSVASAVCIGLGMGLGYSGALLSLAIIREVLGTGSLGDLPVLPIGFSRILAMLHPSGAFIALGLLLGLFSFLKQLLSPEQESKESQI